MNTRRFLNESNFSDEIFVQELHKEHEELFKNYIEESRHFQEITQLYEMLVFDLDEMHACYELFFNDRVISVKGSKVNATEINALIGNATSAAHTLIESIEVYDKEYFGEEGFFKKNYISKTYDKFFSYRFMNFIRNYFQHGHVPISYDGKKIFFQLSEILDVVHMKINETLKKQMKNIEKELVGADIVTTEIAVVLTIYEYFLLIHTLVHEFFSFMTSHVIERYRKVKQILDAHPEYISNLDGTLLVVVYVDEYNIPHGFSAVDNINRTMEKWKNGLVFLVINLNSMKVIMGTCFILKSHII